MMVDIHWINMRIPIRDNQTGQRIWIDEQEAISKYGFGEKEVKKKREEIEKNVSEAASAMQEAVSAKLAEDPKANQKGLIYQWIKANEPYFDLQKVDSYSLWDIHNKTPEPETSTKTSQQEQPDNGILQSALEQYRKLPKQSELRKPSFGVGQPSPVSGLGFLQNYLK